MIPLIGAVAQTSMAEEALVTVITPEDADQSAFAKVRWEVADPGLGHPTPGTRVITPEPGTIALLGVGLAALGAARRRAKQRG
ncbi:MAG: PEP-CTERM sorting domain-containing protein [Candidatus Eiseniibacteriota bacterium]